MQSIVILKEGSRIHLKNKNGMYTVVAVYNDGVAISCNAWVNRASRNTNSEFIPTKFVKYADIKCLAGGCNNRNIIRYKIHPLAHTSLKLNLFN